jgi:hypothetical protein
MLNKVLLSLTVSFIYDLPYLFFYNKLYQFKQLLYNVINIIKLLRYSIFLKLKNLCSYYQID